ncbi:MAG: hypothetical protein ACOZAJ_02120, partial [Patescibacteria group bacterium]
MAEAVDWQRLSSLLTTATDKVVIILPSGQSLVLTSLENYESLVKTKPPLKQTVIKQSSLTSVIGAKRRGRPPKDKENMAVSANQPSQTKLGDLEEINSVPG